MKKISESDESVSKLSDIDILLAQYNQSMDIESEPNEVIETINPEPSNSIDPHVINYSNQETSPTWEGNKDYFQTGKKKGQKKGIKFHTVKQPDTELGGEFLDGAMALTLIDLIIPALFSYLNNNFTDTTVDVDTLMLTDKQKKELRGVAEKTIASLKLTGEPWKVLLFSLTTIYGFNIFVHRKKNKKQFKPDQL